MPIRACPQCSSDRLQFPRPGAAQEFACDDCGWRGQPDEFTSWSAWQESRLAAKAPRPPVVVP